MSSITKAPPSSNDVLSSEESGWTTYFDDFFNNHVDNKCSMPLSGLSSSSLVSDAASLVEKKVASAIQVEEFSVNKKSKRTSFKKRKDAITAFIDDALEDTATSSLNSTKEKGNISGQQNEQNEKSSKGRNSDCTESKKIGLCLICSFVNGRELSMLIT
ncbi:vascular-related unknown protein 1-like isoform X1 [Vigna umbellata]|uniref:Uncharacterized protein n=1 Tax=Vigna angularis var. angularis TaxID=157739 RepID=A0A0S3SAN6_PHAAN|nr:vascular-related unknown protein 1-like isoform X1 [Vigna umbellata]XP_047161578.1 vascular-related unknown protein 1-like isoform X1 [Vigna umbellata]XP_047161596.1 vascular-related unknown protein 1-like isoform X1 [Vigna umbellata]XP_052733936.1 vascular-related unknown protein 1 isoform X1 [Vigna angularis]BAT89944.1 hypothetical protein VIGAN_06108400 [Vigna angularis var. angularis]